MNNLKSGEYIGTVHSNDIWRFFAGTLAEWILDYRAYDPNYNPAEWSGIFRNGLLRVEVRDASKFQEAMQSHELSKADIKSLVAEKGSERVPLIVVIDFDKGLFVNGYYDLALEDYTPPDWRSLFGDPQKYVPDDIRALWLQP